MDEELKKILNQLQVGIYMTDIHTHRILFMNQKMKEDYGVTNSEGKVCWKVFQEGQESPCEFCKIPSLTGQEDEDKLICWQETRNKTGRIYKNYDGLIRLGDAVVHMQQSYDITTLLKLNEQATKDSLCDVWNRGMGKTMLADCLGHLGRRHVCSVVMLDVDNLKAVNDRYGHAEGDFLLQQVCGVLKANMQAPDFMFRLSGDEFVLVLHNKSEKEASKVLRQWREETEVLRQKFGKEYEFSFSFGISSVSGGHSAVVGDIIAQADERMYAEKLCRRKTRLLEENENIVHSVGKPDRKMEYPSRLLYDALICSTDDFVYLCNMKTGVFRYSPAQVAMFELPGEIVESPLKYWKKMVHPDDWYRFYKSNMEIGENKRDSHSVEFRARNRSGEYVWLKCRGQLIRDEYGEPSLFAGIMVLLGKQNKIDPLTQLLNQEEFLKSIRRGIQEESIEMFSIMMLDVDHFRQVNEMHGRAFGDKVLYTLAQTVQSILPDNASLYRLDNDRMGLLLENADAETARELYRRIQERLMLMQEWRKNKLSVEVSAGCSVYPFNGFSIDELYQYADYALQYAKGNGRNRLEVFSQDILQNKLRSLEMIRRLQEDFADGYRGFSLHYQPQADGRTQEIIGVEALMRWTDREGRAVSPAEFIPVMEKQGMIYEAGLWVIKTAVQNAKKWIRQKPDFSLSVNVSALQFLEPGFLEDLQRLLSEEAFPCRNLILELTESCTVQNINIFRDKFNQLRAKGIRVAMDDFGKGYSSLELLKYAPVDIVKIDRCFVENILQSKFDATFISFIVAICHDVGIKVCLEGIEQEPEHASVKTMQLDSFQGYYFGRPQTEGVITELLERQKKDFSRNS